MLALAAPVLAAPIRVTTWNLEWFPNGSPKELPASEQDKRITHPGSGPYPDATFDYLFGSNLIPAKPLITASKASDHYPVTCDFSAGGALAQSPQATPAPSRFGNEDGKRPPAQPPTPQFVTLIQPVKIKIA